MQQITDILTSPFAPYVLIFAAFVLVNASLLSKRGLLSVHTKAVSLGIADNERDVIRQQQRWARTYLLGLEPFIKDLGREDYDDDLTLRCLDRAYIAVVEWITLNHISMDDHYIKIKQDELVSLMYSQGIKSQYRTEEFRDRMESWIRELIQGLYDIRRNHK